MTKIIFLDRDGTLNVDHAYVGQIERFEWIEKTFIALRRLRDAGWKMALVSNQSGIARRYFSWADLLNLEQELQKQLSIEGIEFLSWAYCPHLGDSDPCECRKPQSLLLEELCRRFDTDPKECWMVGDSPRDLEAGAFLGMSVAGVGSKIKSEEWIVYPDLHAFAEHLVQV